MPALFSILPFESVECVVERLPLTDIKSLRLANPEVKNKASRGYFKQFCTDKEGDLKVSDLRELTDKIVPGRVPCLLEL